MKELEELKKIIQDYFGTYNVQEGKFVLKNQPHKSARITFTTSKVVQEY